ncbi:MAG: hypothetical protein ACPIOQ_24385 [Promethearchaeia archaeon]
MRDATERTKALTPACLRGADVVVAEQRSAGRPCADGVSRETARTAGADDT